MQTKTKFLCQILINILAFTFLFNLSSAFADETTVTVDTYLSLNSIPFAEQDTHRIKGSLYLEKSNGFELLAETEMVYTGFTLSEYYPFEFRINRSTLNNQNNLFVVEVFLFRISDGKAIYSGIAKNLKDLDTLSTIDIELAPASLKSINIEKQREEKRKNTPKASITDFSASYNVIKPDRYNRLDGPVQGNFWQPTVEFSYSNTNQVTVSVDFKRCISKDPYNQVRETLADKMYDCKSVQCKYSESSSSSGRKNVRLSNTFKVKTTDKSGRISATLSGIHRNCWCTLKTQNSHRREKETCAYITLKSGNDILDSSYYVFDNDKCTSFEPVGERTRTYLNFI